jgi:gas vesicle protein
MADTVWRHGRVSTEECEFSMGYLRGLRHGAIAGAVLALLYAPDSGVNTRRRVSRLLGQAQNMLSAESGGPAASTATTRRRSAGATESKVKRP